MDGLRRAAAFLASWIGLMWALMPAVLLLAIGTSGSDTSAQTPSESDGHAVDQSASRRDSRRSRTGLAAFPPGPGRDRFVARCGVCHTPRFVLGKGYDRQGWERTMDRMIRFGAHIPAEEYPVIAAYLSFYLR